MNIVAGAETAPLFTVFTATYNRGKLLRRVYESLLAQTNQDFEWLVVDDGSTDDTARIVEAMRQEGRMQIRYVFKKNGGAHTAHNRAVQLARGRFFLRLDSDDACVPKAIETLLHAWQMIPENARNRYSGVSCLSQSSNGEIVGDRYPRDFWSSDWNTLIRLRGDKWGFHRLDVLRQFPFPEFEGEKFCPESLVWGRIHEKYKTLCINEPLHVQYGSSDSITKNMVEVRYRSPKSTELYYREQVERLRGLAAFRHAVNYVRFGLAERGIGEILRHAPRRPIVASAMPLGAVLYLQYQLERMYR